MARISHIALSQDGCRTVAITDLDPSYALTPATARMYGRFYGLQSVTRHVAAMDRMLSTALQQAISILPQDQRRNGCLIYCKTQTHNTRSDRNWLRGFADAHELHDWEVYSTSMTSCASALVQLHMLMQCENNGAIIVLTGEKAFHPSVSRLSVGLLAEAPAAAVLNAGAGGWRILGSAVRHLPRFHVNPDAMSADDRRALQEVYAQALTGFIADSLDHFAASWTPDAIFVPHNLNRPMTDMLIRHFGWHDRTFHGDLAGTGHAYCSDPFINLAAFEASGHPASRVLLLAAGTGVTFATCLLERIPHRFPPPAHDEESRQ